MKNTLGAICFLGLFTEPSSMSWPCLIGWALIVAGCAIGFLWCGRKVKRDYRACTRLPGEL
jgi:hypothetical protein